MVKFIRILVALSKPRIVSLLVFTAACGTVKAADGIPSLALFSIVFLGGGLAASGANAVNQALESRIDTAMRRTRGRPVVNKEIKPRTALFIGILAIGIAIAMLGLFANWISAGLTLTAAAIYVFIYTMLMKQRSWNNIVIGGAAGALPPLIGATAVTGTIDAAGLYMFGLIFFWTPPHFWALSLLLREDYAAAGVPMLPTIVGVGTTCRQITLYVILLLALGWLPYVSGYAGITFSIVATILGAEWLRRSWALEKQPSPHRIKQTYLFSLLYLAVVFFALAIEVLLPWYAPLS